MTIYRNLTYLQKHRYGEGFDLPSPEEGLQYVFVIPYVTFPTVLESLQPFKKAIPGLKAEFLLVSAHKKPKEEVNTTRKRELLYGWAEEGGFPYPIHFLDSFEIPQKKSMKNMAYKIGLDEALNRFLQVENKNGWMVSLDPGAALPADFFPILHDATRAKPRMDALGFGFGLAPRLMQREILQRYLIEGLRFAGHPHAHYTLGNTFAYRSSAYAKNGGIPHKPKGFSFSFVQKFISEERFGELPQLEVPRDNYFNLPQFLDQEQLPSVHLFIEIGDFLAQLPRMFDKQELRLEIAMARFLKKENFDQRLTEMLRHSASFDSFRKRFFAWFGLVRVSKFLEMGKDTYPPSDALETCYDFFELLAVDSSNLDMEKCLRQLKGLHLKNL